MRGHCYQVAHRQRGRCGQMRGVHPGGGGGGRGKQ